MYNIIHRHSDLNFYAIDKTPKDPVPHPTSTNTNDVVRLCCACSSDSVAMISGTSNVALVYDLQKSSHHAAISRYSTRTASYIVFDTSSLSLSSSWLDVVNPDDSKDDAIFQRRIPVKTMIAVGVVADDVTVMEWVPSHHGPDSQWLSLVKTYVSIYAY